MTQDANKSRHPETIERRKRVRKIAEATVRVFCEQFPNAFTASGAPSALKIGIDKDLRQRCEGISQNHIRFAMRSYTGAKRYLSAIVAGASRVDLDGNVTGAVSVAAEAHAKARLEGSPLPTDHPENRLAPAHGA